jgi:hypothetical protein
MKGADFPAEIDYPSSFLDNVRRACRSYKNGKPAADSVSPGVLHEPDATITQEEPLIVLMRPKARMRKTEQRGSDNQRYAPLPSPFQAQTYNALRRPSMAPVVSTPGIAQEELDIRETIEVLPAATPRIRNTVPMASHIYKLAIVSY